LQQLKAVAAGQHDVQDHQIGRKGRQQAFKITAVRDGSKLETLCRQCGNHRQPDGIAVLDDQDPSSAHMAILPAARDQWSAQN
jgi:hypothetical protein